MHSYFRKKITFLKMFSVNPQEDSTCNSQSYSKEKGDILRAGKNRTAVCWTEIRWQKMISKEMLDIHTH